MAATTYCGRKYPVLNHNNQIIKTLPLNELSNDYTIDARNLLEHINDLSKTVIELGKQIEKQRKELSYLEQESLKQSEIIQQQQQYIRISDLRGNFLQDLGEKQYDNQQQEKLTIYYDAFVSRMKACYQASQLINSEKIAPNASLAKSILPKEASIVEASFSLLEAIPIAGKIIIAIKNIADGAMEKRAENKAYAIAHIANEKDFLNIVHKLAQLFTFHNEENILLRNVSPENHGFFAKVSNIWNNISEKFLAKTPSQPDLKVIESLAIKDVTKCLKLLPNSQLSVNNNLDIFAEDILNSYIDCKNIENNDDTSLLLGQVASSFNIFSSLDLF